jgi:fimbrial chaperone protein
MRMLFALSLLVASAAVAGPQPGGVGLSATRMVYPSSASQSSLTVRNTDKQSPFLIQSWVEDEQGNRSNDFVIIPPLFVLKPAAENALKVIFNGKPLPDDRETLYWLTVKAIPQSSEEDHKNVLQFASASRIKLFYRPAGLIDKSGDIDKKISGSLHNGRILLKNPTPYYITTVDLKIDGKKVKSVMIPPKGQKELVEHISGARSFSYRTINDYGSWTEAMTYTLKE